METITVIVMSLIGAAGAFLGLFSLTNLNQDPLDATRSAQANPKAAQQKLKQS